MGYAWSIDPFALHKLNDGTLGNAELVSVQLIDDLIGGSNSGIKQIEKILGKRQHGNTVLLGDG